jgi:hypothetical protein
MLIGTQTNLLWLKYPLTTIGITAFFIIGNLYLLFKKRSEESLLWLLLFLAQFPILLVFYVIDARYIILSLPLLTIGTIHVMEKVKQKKLLYIFLTLAIVLQLLSQLSFFKYLVATNALSRSRAWQYEAVKVLNTQFTSASQMKKPYVITALPPLLVDLYSNHHYELLPLSSTQEFADKKQFVWGSDINYENLTETYTKLLSQGNQVFVSNAYLTSQYEFTAHFDELKKYFVLTEAAEGCVGTCNVWKVELKAN